MQLARDWSRDRGKKADSPRPALPALASTFQSSRMSAFCHLGNDIPIPSGPAVLGLGTEPENTPTVFLYSHRLQFQH